MTKNGNSVYVLKPNLLDKRFDGWVFSKTAKSLLGCGSPTSDFTPDRAAYLDWQPRRLSKCWSPQPVTGNVKLFNDYPCLELKVPVFSGRAVEVLANMLPENGELLRLDAPRGHYFAFNVLSKADVLRRTESRMESLGPGKRALQIEYFSFYKSKLKQLTIFRIPETPNSYFVTDAFKDRVEQAGLNGFTFIKVWPLDAAVDWSKEESARRKKYKRVKLAGQALTLHFRLKNTNPSAREKKLASEIHASLTAEIKVESIQEKYLGTVEASEFAEGELRIACTCPDCDVLAEHLSDWLAQLAWEHDIDIVKRYGNLYGTKAREIRVGVRPMPH